MKLEQVQGMIREIVFALAALLVSFNLFPESNVDTVAAAVIAVGALAWGISVKDAAAAIGGSLVRKAIQSVAPVLVLYEVLTPTQGATVTALVLTVVSVWSTKANNPGK